MNPDLKAMLDDLLAQHDTLSARMDTVTDKDLGRAIITEMQEILHRADLLQNLLMVATTAALAAAVTDVRQADSQLKTQLQNISDAATMIQDMSNFLGYVDTAIDIAKQAALL